MATYKERQKPFPRNSTGDATSPSIRDRNKTFVCQVHRRGSQVRYVPTLFELQRWRKIPNARQTLEHWVVRLQTEAGADFPEKVTAFHKGMAVHGPYGQPCPRCGERVLRIRYAENETNYCARCQTGGFVLADRSLSRLFGSEWPRTLEELEALKRR